jgi:DUF438 domain-containing protein
MAKTYHTSNRWALTGLLKRINLGDDPKLLQSEASHLAEKVDSDDIAAAQQALIDEGYSGELVQKISAAFVLMGLHKEKANATGAELADTHILQKIAAEHGLTRCYLTDLESIAEEINQLDDVSDVSSEYRRLAQTVDYFYRFKRHIEREEDIIFPYLRKFGWTGLSKADEDDHKKIVADIENLCALISSLSAIKFDTFNGYLQKIVQHFVPVLRDHLAYEEDFLWPVALIVIDDVSVWETIKALSDEFEY